MDALISVIVPVYNVEAYLEKCVNSIICQTYKNLEIILVDDGSPDSCPALCDKLALNDERIKVLHKENGGLSSARNAGIDLATGEYIGFVDSDDYILPCMYEKMYDTITKSDSDLCICSYRKVDENGQEQVLDSPIKDEVLTKEQVFSKLFESRNWYYVTAPMKLYKKTLFENLRFHEGKLHEDEFFVHHLFGKCNKVTTISDKLYVYVNRDTSITHSVSFANRLCAIDAFYDRFLFFENLGFFSFALKSLIVSYGHLVSFINSSQSKDHKKQIKDRCKILSKNLLKYKNPRGIKLWFSYFIHTK